MKRILLIFILLPMLLIGCSDKDGDSLNYEVEKIFENETAAWLWPTRPVAVRHVGEFDKTYFGWVSIDGKVSVASYDHENNTYERTIIYEWEKGDDHNQPAIHIRNDGRIIVFAGGHGNVDTIPYFISVKPEDISVFGDEKQILTKEGTSGYAYPQPVYLSDEEKIYLFFRRNATESESTAEGVRGWGFAVSDNNGETFIENDTLLFLEDDVRSPYAVPISNGKDTIYIARSDWKLGHLSYVREDIRFIKYKDGNFYNIDNSQVGSLNDLPISKDVMDVIYDSNSDNGKYAYVSDIALNDQGYPVIAFTTLEKGNDDSGEYDGNGMNYHKYAVWNGSEWIVSEIAEAGGHILEPDRNDHPAYNAGLMLNHDNPSEVVLGREVGGLGSKEFEIEIWKTKDGGLTFEKTVDITANNEQLPNKVFRPIIPRNFHPDLKVLFLGGNYSWYREWETNLYRTYVNEDYITGSYIKVDDEYKSVKNAFIKIDGVWKPIATVKITN